MAASIFFAIIRCQAWGQKPTNYVWQKERPKELRFLVAFLSCHTYAILPIPKVLVAGERALPGRAPSGFLLCAAQNIPTAPLWPFLTIHNIRSDSSISFIKTCLKISPLDFWAYTQRNNLHCDKQINCPELCSTSDMSQSIHFFAPFNKYILNAYNSLVTSDTWWIKYIKSVIRAYV